ncbi:hypothetical protein V1517DRAFT_343528 [Lipomyces orientalis]|uniref:Uncharacterized protein n=1 Tax=Lipomyces orientalis TaxID=1233043 RepID=A0ACC3TVZ5_9ASCO
MVDDLLDPAKRLRREILFVLQLIFATFKLLFNVVRLLIGRKKSAPSTAVPAAGRITLDVVGNNHSVALSRTEAAAAQ